MRDHHATKALIGTIALALGSPLLGTQTATAEVPEPSNVRIGWSDPDHTAVRVTWDESGDQPNHVAVLTADGGGTGYAGVYTDAGGPNIAELEVSSDFPLGRAALRVGVSFGTPSGGDTGPYGLSEVFDTLLPPRPVVNELHGNTDGPVVIGWQPDPATDLNAGDPLDLTQPATLFQVLAVMTELNAWQRLGTPSTATRYTVPAQPEPYLLGVTTSPNEWGTAGSRVVYVDSEEIRDLRIPVAVEYGRPTVITGTLVRTRRACDPSICWLRGSEDTNRLVILRARDSASSPWYVVGSTRTPADRTAPPAFRFQPATVGNRQFEIVVPEVLQWEGTMLARGATSGRATVLVRPRVLSARFTDPVVSYGQRVTAVLRIQPAGTVRTTLQRWNGAGWTGLKWVYLNRGAGSYTFTARQRGTTRYRFYIPPYRYAGRTIAGLFTGTFTLTTR